MDALVRLLQLLVLLLTLPLHIMALLGFWEPLCKSYFPYLMAVLAAKTNRKMEGKKREIFSQIKGLAGASGKMALLELGCGTGANFQFYPSGCRITCLDPNPNFEKFLTKSMAENRHLEYERFVVAFGEDMKQLADGSMDVVVCTLVLCSVQSPRKVLQEVQRVLRPVSRVGRVWVRGSKCSSGHRHVRGTQDGESSELVHLTPVHPHLLVNTAGCGSPQESHPVKSGKRGGHLRMGCLH